MPKLAGWQSGSQKQKSDVELQVVCHVVMGSPCFPKVGGV